MKILNALILLSWIYPNLVFAAEEKSRHLSLQLKTYVSGHDQQRSMSRLGGAKLGVSLTEGLTDLNLKVSGNIRGEEGTAQHLFQNDYGPKSELKITEALLH